MIDLVPDMSNCLSPEEIFAQTKPSIVRIVSDEDTEHQSVSTGLIVDKNGTVVTSAHVVSESQEIFVESQLDGRQRYVKKYVGGEYSIAVIVPQQAHPASVYVPLNKIYPVVGQQVFTIGYPFDVRLSYTTGYISAKLKKESSPMLQLDMSIAPGMSGSPVFDCQARPVGVILGHLSWSSHIGFANEVNEVISAPW